MDDTRTLTGKPLEAARHLLNRLILDGLCHATDDPAVLLHTLPTVLLRARALDRIGYPAQPGRDTIIVDDQVAAVLTHAATEGTDLAGERANPDLDDAHHHGTDPALTARIEWTGRLHAAARQVTALVSAWDAP